MPEITMDASPTSGAALKVALQGLGLLPSWFAEHMGVTMRTVVRWFDSDTVAPEVAAAADKLSEKTLDEMRKMLKTVGDDDPVRLWTYRTDSEFPGQWPATWHRALTFRVREHLIAQGKTVTVEYR